MLVYQLQNYKKNELPRLLADWNDGLKCPTKHWKAAFSTPLLGIKPGSSALICVQNSITMPHLVLIQLMRVIKWLGSDADGSCVNKMCVVIKGFTVFSVSISAYPGTIYFKYIVPGLSKRPNFSQ